MFKFRDKLTIIVLLFFILTSIILTVSAEQEEIEPTLDVKLKIYERILARAQEAGVDTTEAEKYMEDVYRSINSGYEDVASSFVDRALLKLLEGLKSAGVKEVEKLLTPSPEPEEGEATPTPPAPNNNIVKSTPYPTSSISQTYNYVNSDSKNRFTRFGGSSLTMVEKFPIYWLKPDKVADIRWDIIEQEKGKYNWEQLDRFYSKAMEQNINLFVNITGIPSWDNGQSKNSSGENQYLKKLPNDTEAYKAFIKAIIERYDGDGLRDASSNIKIAYYQIGREIDSTKNTYGQSQWIDSIENYANLIRITKQSMKRINMESKLILGSSGDYTSWGKRGEINPITQTPFEQDGWFVTLFETLKTLESQESSNDGISIYFDGIDFSNYGGTTDQSVNVNLTYKPLDKGIDLVKKRLYEYGYKDAEIFVTGNSIYTGSPVAYSGNEEKINYVPVSEEEQAVYLVKSLLVPIAKGVKGVFWSVYTDDPPGETVKYGVTDSFYSYSGLENWDQTPKLSFYTYKLLSEHLQGAKFNQPFTGLERDVYGYSFVKDGRPFYIFWNDSQSVKSVRINGEQGKTYSILSLVTSKDGKVNMTEFRADEGLITFDLSSAPVIIRQK